MGSGYFGGFYFGQYTTFVAEAEAPVAAPALGPGRWRGTWRAPKLPEQDRSVLDLGPVTVPLAVPAVLLSIEISQPAPESPAASPVLRLRQALARLLARRPVAEVRFSALGIQAISPSVVGQLRVTLPQHVLLALVMSLENQDEWS